jgi:arylsulfatase A-like enzyme
LIVRVPDGGAHGRQVDRFTEAVDVMPTILDWLGCEVPIACDGESLMPFCRGDDVSFWRSEAHYEFDFRDVLTEAPQRALGLRMEQCCLAAIRDGHWKYVHFPTLPALLFDLENDPGEFRNLAADLAYAPRVLEYAQKLLSWRMEHSERTLTGMQAGPNGLKSRREPRR